MKGLKGDIEIDSSFSFKHWFGGTFQMAKEKHVNDAFNLRADFIRLNNQIQFSLFGKPHARDVIIGKHEVMFERGYIDAYNGLDFIGENQIQKNVSEIKKLQDSLTAHGKLLITVVAADKAYFYPNDFPDSLSKQKQGHRNYEIFINEFEKQKINYINYNKWLLDLRLKSKYPLYPRHGIHWSLYAGSLVLDSLDKFIEHQLHVDIPNVVVPSIEVKNEQQTDRDLLDGLNIFYGFSRDKYAYPYLYFEKDSDKTKPTAMVLGDSFFWTLQNYYFFSSFSHGQFWYYNNEVYSFDFKEPKHKSDLDLRKEINSHQIIILFARVSNLHCIGWGFVEEANEIFAHHSPK